ncbi:MAG TPA: hypothetical protein GXX26_02965 [Clostridiaceae bacterium]|jgi:hypothetical protein|nr:hypothetical protein [Clostridiaceae bacterium]
MLHNINWDVYPDWVRFLNRETRPENTDNASTRRQKHVHEFVGSTRLEDGSPVHNHRFAGVTGQAIPIHGGSHKHRIIVSTDFFNNHFHEIEDCTGPAIDVGNGRHVHFVKGRTTVNDGHSHSYQFATLIENPIAFRD